MELRAKVTRSELTALLIAPDRTLAGQFTASQSGKRVFQILSDLKSYPSRQTLDIRLKQLRPDVVIIDVQSNLETAGAAIQFITSLDQPVQVVGIHSRGDSEALLTCLRLGASEFLHAPFDTATQMEAFSRLLRLREPEPVEPSQPGTVTVFSSAKPGSGASTLAFHTSFSLRSAGRKRILLIDLDLAGGMIGFFTKLDHPYSVLDAFENSGQLDDPLWNSLVANCDGVDILPAPAVPFCGVVEAGQVAELFDYARAHYDLVLIDAPAVFKRVSLMAVSNADRALLISSAEIASVHLARRAVQLLDRLGFPRDRFQIVVNRVNRNDDVARSGLEKLFSYPVSSRLPNDYLSLHRVLTLGHPLEADCDLGKAIQELGAALMAPLQAAGGQPTPARVQ